ncbi:hypothetical protein BACFRA24663_06850 [Bacteroides fragilis]
MPYCAHDVNKTSVPKETLTSVTNFFENYFICP